MQVDLTGTKHDVGLPDANAVGGAATITCFRLGKPKVLSALN